MDIVSYGFKEFASLLGAQRETLLNPRLSAGMKVLAFGADGTGKTWLFMSIGKALTTGHSLGPWVASRAVRVMYVWSETSAKLIKDRGEILGLTDEFRVYDRQTALELNHPVPNLLDPVWRYAIKSHCTQHHIEVVIFDSITSLTLGGTGTKKEWEPIDSWQNDMKRMGVATIMLAHVNVNGQVRDTLVKRQLTDMCVRLEKLPASECAFRLQFEKNWDGPLPPNSDWRLNNGVWRVEDSPTDIEEKAYKRAGKKLLDKMMEFLLNPENDQYTSVYVADKFGYSESRVRQIRIQINKGRYKADGSEASPSEASLKPAVRLVQPAKSKPRKPTGMWQFITGNTASSASKPDGGSSD